MRKVVLLGLVMALLVATPAAAQDDPDEVLIFPFRVDEITISSDQPVVLHSTWAACNRGMIQTFLAGINIQWTLDGAALFSTRTESRPFWVDPFIRDTVPPGTDSVCVNHLPPSPGPDGELAVWATEFLYPLGTLEVGSHELSVQYPHDHPIMDLGDYDGDGRPDFFYLPGIWTTMITVVQ